ncbi:Tetrathionate reductase sensory transduction histidine kinase [hydrothermal vent metagenome]|uniref:Tetrathionate reductase sensory transduction histidine kinase n=1 Tax=hydrothermal vent metagenome TaxID=652676 RepID=A0A3B1C7H5_9ZZZZ
MLFFCGGLFSVYATPVAESQPRSQSVQNKLFAQPVKTLDIGVLAFRGEKDARIKWHETIKYLNSKISDVHFRMRAFTLPQMRRAVAERAIAFILTNPGNYIELEAEYGVSRIVTLDSGKGDETGMRGTIGSAIVVRSDHQNLRTLSDLDGKSLMAVSKHAFGGFQVVWWMLENHKIDPFSDLSRIDFVGFPQDKIAYAVINRRVDAGVLRACVLEEMTAEGKIKKGVLRVLHPQSYDDFPCKISSRLYPDWPFSKLRSTSNKLAKRVAQALLSMPADSDASRSGGYAGWTIHMDYQPVHELFRGLQIGPYRWMRSTNFQQLWQRYRHWIVIFLLSLLWGIWHMVRVEHLVALRTQQLSKANQDLKTEMDERQKAEERVRSHQSELAHVSRISAAGELASGMAHEINQPLSAINSYAQGTAWRLQAGEMKRDELIEVHQLISRQAERAGTIIQRFRGFLRKQEIICTDVDINKAIEEALELFSTEAQKREVSIELHLARRLPPVCAEMIQVEQVFLNLMRNAAEAMQELDAASRILTICSEDNGNSVLVEFHDNGPGISDEVAAHLFDPFFTTRDEGMGLGLSISRSIVESHGGQLVLLEYGKQGLILQASWPLYKGEDKNEH